MGPRRDPDVTTKPELINNIDISIILMFVVRNTLNKTRKGSCWSLSLNVVFPNMSALLVKDPGSLCTTRAQTRHSSYQIQDVHPRQQRFGACI